MSRAGVIFACALLLTTLGSDAVRERASAQVSPGVQLADPAGTAPSAADHAVSVRSARPLSVSFQRIDDDGQDEPSFRRTCATDCTLRLSPAMYRVSSKRSGQGEVLGGPLRIAEPGELRLSHVDNETTRMAGVIVLLSAITVGVALVGGAVIRGLVEPWVSPDDTVAMMLAGGSIAAVGLGVGLALAFVGDQLHLRFQPAR
jgi:hypothetical protein